MDVVVYASKATIVPLELDDTRKVAIKIDGIELKTLINQILDSADEYSIRKFVQAASEERGIYAERI